MVWNVIAAVAAVITVLVALLTTGLAGLAVVDSSEAHAEQMGARRHYLVAEIRLQRAAQVGRLTDVMTAIARVAHDDMHTQSAPAAISQLPSMLPILQVQLRTELATFRALGGPDLPQCEELAAKRYGDADDETARQDAMRTLAKRGLGELQSVVDAFDQLSLKLNEGLRLADLSLRVKQPTQPRAWVRFIRRAVRPD